MSSSDTEKHDTEENEGENSDQLPELPEELVSEILQRIPVKSVSKLRSSCKSFNTLFSSHDFVRNHHAKSKSSQLLVTFKNHYDKFEIRNCCLSELLNHRSCVSVDLDYPKKPQRCVEIVNSCNGLICIAFDEEFVILWNPSTRKFRELPTYHPELRCGDAYLVYGFGYDGSSNDFKVVSIFCLYSGPNTYKTNVKVFSLKSNTWRTVEAFPFGVVPSIPYGPLDYPGQFVNGSLHWLTTRVSESTTSSSVIVSFDLKSERFGEVSQPIYDVLEDTKFTLMLGTLRNSLCVFCNYKDTRADLWILNEYGVMDSWTKLLTFPTLSEPPALLFMSEKSDIVFRLGSNILVYSSKDGKFKVVEISGITDCDCLEATSYTESLFPSDDDSNFWVHESADKLGI